MAKGYTFYSKNAGLEIKAVAKKNESDGVITKEGRIALRFFTLSGDNGNGSVSVRFILTPSEAYDLFMKSHEIIRSGGKKYLVHKYQDGDKEIESKLKLEKWERDGKSGYAYAIKRQDNQINVPMDGVHFAFAGELLRALSTDQAWFSFKRDGENAETESETEQEVVAEEEF